MKWFERIVERLSPQKAYERQYWRSALDFARSYDAAAGDRLTEGWKANGATGQATDSQYRDRLRNRARDLERNSDILNGMVSAFERNVIGDGLRLQAKTDSPQKNAEIEHLWREWCRPENCDATRQQSFDALTRMMLRRKKVDGGILVYFVREKRGRFPLKLQLLEVDSLCLSHEPRHKGNRVIDGVEVDAQLRHVGYWITQSDVEGWNFSPPRFISAKDVIFFWRKNRPSQVREVSELAPTLMRIRDITSFMGYTAEKEKVGAAFAVFVTSMSAAQQSIGRGSLAPTAQPSRTGYNEKLIEPGMIAHLQPGESIQSVSPPNSGASAADYVKLQQNLAGAGQGLSYEVTSRDMSSTNYSSARQGLIEDKGTFDIERSELVDLVMRRVYQEFIESVITAGTLTLPEYFSDKDAATRHMWVAPAKPWIDPLKEANANKVALESRQKTLTQIYAENGRDIEDVAAELEVEEELLGQLGGNNGQDKKA